jgi:hypothetical protein
VVHSIIVCYRDNSISVYHSIDGRKINQLDIIKNEDGSVVSLTTRPEGAAFIVVTDNATLVVTIHDKGNP